MSKKTCATFAPKWALKVNNEPLSDSIKSVIETVEFESYDGMADMLRLRMKNPRGEISNSKVFQPGNEVSTFAGYGSENLEHLGRAVIVRQLPTFPQNGESTLEVIGYSKDYQLMDNEPGGSTKRTYAVTEYDGLFDIVAATYGFKTDIDPWSPRGSKDLFQKVGVSDYEFVKGLANIAGNVFWVDADEKGVWTMHLKNPDNIKDQEIKYNFQYNYGDSGTLLSFRPEVLIKGAKTKISVLVKDKETGNILKAEIEEESDSPELDASGDQAGSVNAPFSSGSSIKLYFNDFSFEVVSSKTFKTEFDVSHWAQQWFRRMRDNFVLAQGKIIGVETIKARETHGIKGISPAYDGDYYFTKVRHVLNSSGYTIDFGARKIIK